MENSTEYHQFIKKESEGTEMDDFEDFEKEVENIGNMIRGLACGDLAPEDVDAIQNSSERKTNSTGVNKKPIAEKPPMQGFSTERMSQEDFMRTVEQDANRRYEEREERNRNWRRFTKKAKVAFQEENYERALSLYNQALDLRRDSSLVYCNRATTYLRLGLFTKACQDCDAALKLEDSFRARLLKSRALFEMGESVASAYLIEETKQMFPRREPFIAEYVATWNPNS